MCFLARYKRIIDRRARPPLLQKLKMLYDLKGIWKLGACQFLHSLKDKSKVVDACQNLLKLETC